MIQISKPIIKQQEINSVIKVLQSGHLVQGKVVEKLEKKFSEICGTKFSIATNSGTSALHSALHALGIRYGDEVITSPFTFVATANSIIMTGAKPVFVDIQEDTFNINPKEIEKKINKKTKAILTVDLFGQPADYSEINKLAKKNNLFVVEDAAQSIGSTYFKKRTGNLADIACFSLYATKNITSGEGGVITTNNKTFDKAVRMFRNQGQDENKRYEYKGIGYNYRMTDLAAAIAFEQLKRLDLITKKRQRIAKIYDQNFQDIPGLTLPFIREKISSVYHQYTLRVTKKFKLSRDEFIEYLMSYGIQANIYYPIPLYRVDHLKLDHDPINFPVTEQIVSEVVSIPIHPSLSAKEIEHIVSTIKKI